MQHRSLDAMPIDDIVKTAGVGKGMFSDWHAKSDGICPHKTSFFNHFGNKQNYADVPNSP